MAIFTAKIAKNNEGKRALIIDYKNLEDGKTYPCGDTSPRTKLSEIVDFCYQNGKPGDFLLWNGYCIQFFRKTVSDASPVEKYTYFAMGKA